MEDSNSKTNISLHKLINKETGRSLFTGDSAEITNLVAQVWDDDGIAFSLFTSLGSRPEDQIDVLRLYNPSTSDHFFTTDSSEASAAIATGYTYEATIGRAFLQLANRRTLLHR